MDDYSNYIKRTAALAQSADEETKDELLEEATQERVERRTLKKKRRTNTRSQFKEARTACQVKLPTDLLQSIRLQAVSQGRTISDIILDCLTSEQMVSFTWISSNREAERAKNDAA